VGHDRRHLSEGGELVAFDQSLLRGHELGQIAERADGAEHSAIGLEDTRERQVRREGLAIPRDRRHAPAPGSPGAHRLLDLRPDPSAIALVQDVEVTQRSGGNLVAQPPPPGLVQGHDLAVGVAGEDAVLRAFDHGGQQALGATERALERFFRLLDGPAVLGDPDRPLARIPDVQHIPDEIDPDVGAVPATHVELRLERLALGEQRGGNAAEGLVFLIGPVQHPGRDADDVVADIPVHFGELGVVPGDPAVAREDHPDGGVLHDRLHLAQGLAQRLFGARASSLLDDVVCGLLRRPTTHRRRRAYGHKRFLSKRRPASSAASG
jgi:hypothetical protein